MRRRMAIVACLAAFGLGAAASEKDNTSADPAQAAVESRAALEAPSEGRASTVPRGPGQLAPAPGQRPLERLKTPPLAPDANIPLPQDI